MTFIEPVSTIVLDLLPKVPSILADIYWAGSLISEIVVIPFTQSTAVSRKYLNDELKLLCYHFFQVTQNSLSFPCSEKSPSIPSFPGLWWEIINLQRDICKIPFILQTINSVLVNAVGERLSGYIRVCVREVFVLCKLVSK